jgi:hypothetical protein
MTVLTEGKRSFFINTKAILVDSTKDVASNWASKYIYDNAAIKWVLAKYIEVDQANSNGQMWTLEDVRMKFPTVNNSPMNIDHQQNQIVGTWIGSELLYPLEEQSNIFNPYVEVLGAYWSAYFPETLRQVEEAFNSGSLYVSMECSAESVTCAGTSDACGRTFAYDGPFSDTYCEHIKERASYRQLNDPHFLGGALILPPNKPGWKSADVTDISEIEIQKVMTQVEADHPELCEAQWREISESIVYRATLDRLTSKVIDVSRSLDDLNLTPTAGMIAEAKRGLAWRDEYNRGGTAVGIARARDIANRKRLSPDTVMRMHSFFSRHEVDKKGQGFSGGDGFPSNGRIAWALWGGDPGQSWARKYSRQIHDIRKGN